MTRSRRLLLTQTQGPARRLSAMALSVDPGPFSGSVAPRVAVAVISTEVVLAAVMFLIALFGTDSATNKHSEFYRCRPLASRSYPYSGHSRYLNGRNRLLTRCHRGPQPLGAMLIFESIVRISIFFLKPDLAGWHAVRSQLIGTLNAPDAAAHSEAIRLHCVQLSSKLCALKWACSSS